MPETTRAAERLAALARRPLFSVEAMNYTWNDVLAWAEARGTLGPMRRASHEGAVLLRQSLEAGGRPSPEAVSAAATAFRYARGLLSAEQLSDWFARWNLTVTEWGEHFERMLLVERARSEGTLTDVSSPPDKAELAEVEYVDAVCTGFLEEEARAFAADMALADLTPIEVAGDQRTMVERALIAAAVARREAASRPGVDQEIARRGLDWTRLELDVLELGDPGAANEAAMCIRVDGSDIAEVAAASSAQVEHLSVYLGDLDPSLQPSLLAAQPGELVGPIEDDETFVLFAIHDRTPASTEDPELRRRAETALVERAVKRATEGRVRWHEHL
jgi:hypothetical protein